MYDFITAVVVVKRHWTRKRKMDEKKKLTSICGSGAGSIHTELS